MGLTLHITACTVLLGLLWMTSWKCHRWNAELPCTKSNHIGKRWRAEIPGFCGKLLFPRKQTTSFLFSILLKKRMKTIMYNAWIIKDSNQTILLLLVFLLFLTFWLSCSTVKHYLCCLLFAVLEGEKDSGTPKLVCFL